MRECVTMDSMKASCLSTIVTFKCHLMSAAMGSVTIASMRNWYGCPQPHSAMIAITKSFIPVWGIFDIVIIKFFITTCNLCVIIWPRYIVFLQVCRLCKPCRTERETFELKRAFLEHVSRRNFRRLLPDSKHRDQLSSRNDVMRTWFIGKCQFDASWCV